MCASMYFLMTGIRIPPSPDRQKHDTVQRLQVMGVPISDEWDIAICKGLSIEPENRYQSIRELYQDLYHE